MTILMWEAEEREKSTMRRGRGNRVQRGSDALELRARESGQRIERRVRSSAGPRTEPPSADRGKGRAKACPLFNRAHRDRRCQVGSTRRLSAADVAEPGQNEARRTRNQRPAREARRPVCQSVSQSVWKKSKTTRWRRGCSTAYDSRLLARGSAERRNKDKGEKSIFQSVGRSAPRRRERRHVRRSLDSESTIEEQTLR